MPENAVKRPSSLSLSCFALRNLAMLAGLMILFPLFTSKPAKAVQPRYSSGLTGTWVNTQPGGLIAQVVISPGTLSPPQLHFYGVCSPAPCDWGSHGGSWFSAGVTPDGAIGFRVTIGSPSDTKTIQGHLISTGELEITTQVSYPAGDSSNQYEVTDEFQLQGTTGGPPPNASSNASGLSGAWMAVKGSGGITQLIVTDSTGALQIHPYASCSPNDCDWGVQPASQFSNGPTSSTRVGLQSSINQTFASRFLQGHFIQGATGETLLEITTQTTFAKSDSRYDYELTEDFQLATDASQAFSMNAASASLTIASGSSSTDVITITPVNGSWDSAVQLSCSIDGSSPAPTCALSEPSVTPGRSAVTSTLTINMPTIAALEGRRLPRSILYAILAPFALGVAFTGTSTRRRTTRRLVFLLSGLATLSLAQIACGGGMQNKIMKQSAGPFTVQVVASSGNIQLSSQITVTMQ